MNKSKKASKRPLRPEQHQRRQPGVEFSMVPQPESSAAPAGQRKLQDKVAIITGGDSGIGRATAIAFAEEGASVAIVYLNETRDSIETQRLVESRGGKCLRIRANVGDERQCRTVVEKTLNAFHRLDIVVNNAAEQNTKEDIRDITSRQLERTFRTNIFSMFYMVKAALPKLPEGGSIINTTSVTAYRGSAHLLDYSATKGAIVAFTRSLSQALAPKKIRVNAVAPGPIWTPLIPSTFPRKKVKTFGSDVPLGRAGEPNEVAPCFVFLAGADASFMTGQVLHPNGGEIING